MTPSPSAKGCGMVAPSYMGGVVMKGSVVYRKDRGLFCVNWYDRKAKKPRRIYKYRGEYMYHRRVAEKLLAQIQADEERGILQIERYIREQPTDVVPYLREWLGAIGPTLKPATLKDYHNSIENHLVPFFEAKEVQLHEIRYDVLVQLMNAIQRSGKGKQNVMYCLHACLDYAWRSDRIQAVPPFPKRKQYQLEEPTIKWVPEARQIEIIEAIPEEHQPIFWWCKYHFRRPGEACALHRTDFDGKAFRIHRTFSARKLTTTTKTGEVHEIPCHDDFRPIMERMPKGLSPYFFVNPRGRMPGKPYSLKVMEDLWNAACRKVGEKIGLYAGVKHSSCSSFLNEKGGSYSELQVVTDHKRYESVKRYGKVEVERRRELMHRKVVGIDVRTVTEGEDK